MTVELDYGAIARGIIDGNLYMVLGTADEAGQPWVTPVYYATADYKNFYWVSSPDTQHSRNLSARPHLSIVIFDSQAAINTGQAVYMSAVAGLLEGAELAGGLELYSRAAVAHGGRAFAAGEVTAPARLRLYRATAAEHWILDPVPDRAGDDRVLVTL